MVQRAFNAMQILSKFRSSNRNRPDLVLPQVLEEEKHKMFAEAAAWDSQDHQGFLQISFDARTSQRKHVMINSRFAQLHGCHKEELLSRFASHEVDFHRTDLDLLIMGLQNFLVSAEAHPSHSRHLLFSLQPFLVRCFQPLHPFNPTTLLKHTTKFFLHPAADTRPAKPNGRIFSPKGLHEGGGCVRSTPAASPATVFSTDTHSASATAMAVHIPPSGRRSDSLGPGLCSARAATIPIHCPG
jgi:hypothetical protein